MRVLPLRLIKYGVISLLSLIAGCTQDRHECSQRVNEEFSVGNAGCWLEKNNGVLLVQQRNGKYSFPGGTAKPAENAQCTAHRETWEEAGIDVSVGKLKHRFENGFRLYECFSDTAQLTTKDSLEVKRVIYIRPELIPKEQWRFPDQRQLAIDWLVK